ncbi:MAG TPA: DUF5996 family protein [Ignavibacteriales bacterium]|nr:DUF5996 family protein [Ignavibacteriales bacterium]
MQTLKEAKSKWPALPYENWKDTLDTLHMWMQIAGKVKLALHPFTNHWWQTAFHLTSTGIRSGLIPYQDRCFEISFDFIKHKVFIHMIDGSGEEIELRPRTVADFYNEFMNALRNLDITVKINPVPVEFAETIPFDKDNSHSSYDKDHVCDWWRLQARLAVIFERFRTPFRGKSSAVHFFWGSFDLNSTRFCGRPATPPNYGGKIMHYAENEENFSFGFWPGDSRYPHPALYAYLYPAPAGIESAHIEPEEASYNTTLGEFILPYEDVCNSSSPETMIMDFLQSSYKESAKLANWDTNLLEGPVPF